MPPATTSAQALGNLQAFQGQMKSGGDILNQQEQSLGVPQAQQQVSGLRQAITNTTNLLNQVAPSVYGRTQNSLVTSAQAGRQIQNEQAPLAQQLGKQNTDYSNASTDYRDLLGKAGTLATLESQDQTSKLSGLKDIYTALYQQEQDALTRDLENRKLAEAARQANLSRGSSGIDLSSLLSGLSGASSTSAANITYKNPAAKGASGFNFTTSAGKPISAASYATLTGQTMGDVLYQMGQSGDRTAQAAYNAIKTTGKLTPQLRSRYSSLFWGT